VPWSLGVPDALDGIGSTDDAPSVFRRFSQTGWIVNSRNTADEDVVRAIAAAAGLVPQIGHRADTLELVHELIVAGLGVGLLPRRPATRAGRPPRSASAARRHAALRRGHPSRSRELAAAGHGDPDAHRKRLAADAA
jgi:DNA-binding transcriptional LysR family regulator